MRPTRRLPLLPALSLASTLAFGPALAASPLEPQVQPRRWPSAESQLRTAGAPEGSPLAKLILENQDFARLRPEEAADNLPIPPWLRVLWRRSHPLGALSAGDPSGGYPWVLPEVYEWMRTHPDLRPPEGGGLDAIPEKAAASAPQPASGPLAAEVEELEEKVSIGPDTNLSGASRSGRAESDLRINFWNPSQVVAAANDLTDTGTQAQFYSSDGGETWQQNSLPRVLGDTLHSDPTVDWTSDGTAWSTTIGVQFDARNDFILALRSYRSSDGGATWTFDETISGDQNEPDKQMMWVDHSPASPYRDNLYVCYHNSLFPYVVRRVAATGHWDPPVVLDGDPGHATGLGCDVKSNGAGAVYVFWPSTDTQRLYQAKSTDGGATWSAPRAILKTFASAFLLPPSMARRGILLYAASAAFKAGKKDLAYLAWTDLSGAAGCKTPLDAFRINAASNCKTRIWFARSTNGGKTWGRAIKLNDRKDKTDQFHPWIAVDETSGALALIYYDTAGDPNRHAANVWVQTSTDSGAHWTTARQVSSAPTDETTEGASGFQFGDYNALSGIAGRFLPSWTDRRGGARDQIWTAPITIP